MTAPVAKGKLRIKSSPSGARVWIDHEEVGRTPLEIDVDAGAHHVRIAADFHQPYARKVKVTARKRGTITAELSKGNGGVELDTDLEGAKITVMSKPGSKGKEFPAPLRLSSSIKEGTYYYRVTAPGHEPLEGQFTWTKGKNIYLWLELESSMGRFSVITDPPGASVILNGEDIGTSPIELNGIDQGRHLVQVSHKGYASVLRVVDTSDGSSGALDVSMTKKGARVIVRTGSRDGVVSVEGVDVASGSRIVFPKLEKGRYSIEISAPGKKTAEGRLVVPTRGFARVKGKLKSDKSRARSTVVKIRPFYAHWGFWTAVGVTAGGSTTGSILYWQAIQPNPIDQDADQTVLIP